jgi:hypothetical protein
MRKQIAVSDAAATQPPKSLESLILRIRHRVFAMEVSFMRRHRPSGSGVGQGIAGPQSGLGADRPIEIAA